MSSINVFLSMSNTAQSGQTGSARSGSTPGSALSGSTLHPVPPPGSNGSHFGEGHGPRWKQGKSNQSSHYLGGPDGRPVASVDIRPLPQVHVGHHVHVGHNVPQGYPVHVGHHVPQGHHVLQGHVHVGHPVHVGYPVPQGHTGRSVQVGYGGVHSRATIQYGNGPWYGLGP